MDRQEEVKGVVRQPARGQPIEVPRPPLDWGDEEPDEVWERLYYKGLVNPPYRSGKDFRDSIKDWKPIGVKMSDADLMRALGRWPCEDCPYDD